MTDRIGPKKPFRHFIKEWIEYRDLNQERIAWRMETESGTISKLLTGRMRMSDKWLVGFATALDCEVADLFVDPNRPTQDELLAGLDDASKAIVIDLIQKLRKSA